MMKRIVLVFSDPNELRFISENLRENYEVINTAGLDIALKSVKEIQPSLVVINISGKENEISPFIQELKKINVKSLLLSEPKKGGLYKNDPAEKLHLIIQPLRPKLLLSLIRSIMNEEELDWVPVAHN